jgi:hypothetical protein
MLKESPYDLDSLKITQRGLRVVGRSEVTCKSFWPSRARAITSPVYLTRARNGYAVLGDHWALEVDIDFERGVIRVRRQWHERLNQYGPTKGGEVRDGCVSIPKANSLRYSGAASRRRLTPKPCSSRQTGQAPKQRRRRREVLQGDSAQGWRQGHQLPRAET